MENFILYITVALVAVLVLTVWTNAVVQVTKKIVAWERFPVQAYVAIVAIVSTLVAVAVAMALLGVHMLWYHWVATIVLGVFVCYAAMFGYDNLYKQVMDTYKIIKQILAGTYKNDSN